jgi:chromosome segregation ATPase
MYPINHQSSTGSSYAALEQLTQNLKAAKKELETLRKRLAESEKTKESLLEDLGESREAKEKLPLFEAKVKELMADNREKELEVRGLQDDIAEVKEMYRSQLNMLLEEKAAAEAAKKPETNGHASEPDPAVEEPVPELVEDALGIS